MPEYHYNLGLRFQQVVASFSTRTAISIPGGPDYSYAELNALSNRFAHFLRSVNVQKSDVVAILNNKSVHGYAAILGCLKAGVIYTNIDFTSPLERVEKILRTCAPRLVLDDHTESEVAAALQGRPDFKLHDIGSAEFHSGLAALSPDDPAEMQAVTGADPAYLMFTSGSTGFPKGAVMSHSNVLNFVKWGQSTFGITHEDVFTNVNQIYFDNSVFDIYTSLMSGATLVPVAAESVKDPKSIVRAINESKCTVWFSVPSLLVYLLTTRALSPEDFGSIRRILFGGEGFPKAKLKQLYDLYGNRLDLYNVYGPTECTCICSSYKITDADFVNMNELAPLGFLAPNFSYEIFPLDEADADTGELVLGGPNVGLGYYNDPERTKQSFISNPRKKYFEWMYKTGDLVKRDANGHLHFKGRVDNQVKHMGYRIELEEIEAAFNGIPYVNEVGVVYEKMSISDAQKTSAELLAEIKKIVPAYMVPRVIVILDTLPKNQNGKVDRKQLSLLK
jgi:D-alanine--poly(phosphoribitol) ligase subunit 1